MKWNNEEIVSHSLVVQRGGDVGRPPLPRSSPPTATTPTTPTIAPLALTSCRSSSNGVVVNTSQSRSPIRSCSIELSNRHSRFSTLVFERRQPTLVTAADASLHGIDPFSRLPWPVLYSIFSTFELVDRLVAAQVCRRWRSILLDGRFPLSDLNVLNIFEQSVWDEKLSRSLQNGKVECIQLQTFEPLDTLLRHCASPRVVKVWYRHIDFLDVVLHTLAVCCPRLYSLDIYPYSSYVGTSLVYEALPHLKTIAMRPHGNEYFFNGLDLAHFPAFENLHTLNVDSFNFIGCAFPINLRKLDWQCRNENALEAFTERVSALRRLESLVVGHASFSSVQFLRFINSIGMWTMPCLTFLHFKLVKFTDIRPIEWSSNFNIKVLNALRFLRLELCYGSLSLIADLFLRFTGPNLKTISFAFLTDSKAPSLQRLFAMDGELARRSLNIQLSLMEPSDSPIKVPTSCTLDADDNDTKRSDDDREPSDCSPLFARLLSKFEASFMSTSPLLERVLAADIYPNLTDIKFIQCPGVDDRLLTRISNNCPALRRLAILSCHECTKYGISQFVSSFDLRDAGELKIIWQRDRGSSGSSSITDLFLTLNSSGAPWLPTGIKMRSYRKQFRARYGEQIVAWSEMKTLYIQDYDTFDSSRIVGVVLPSSTSCDTRHGIYEHDDSFCTPESTTSDDQPTDDGYDQLRIGQLRS